MSITNIFDQLKRDEGLRLTEYTDSRGFKTVGYGHNLDANPLPNPPFDTTNGLTTDQADFVLRNDVLRISTRLVHDLPWIVDLPAVIEGVLLNMSFNMGAAGLEAFHHMLADIQAGNYQQAAIDGMSSLWAKQVGQRAHRLMAQLASGEWQ